MIEVLGKQFVPYMTSEEIQSRVAALGEEINRDYAGHEPLFIVMLNGAFMFAADLMKHVSLPCMQTFVKYSSYEGMSSTGVLKEEIPIRIDLTGRDVIIIEDIIDSGYTMSQFVPLVKAKGAASVKVCALLQKPAALCYPTAKPDYVGFEIPNDFIIGYGLDLDGYARNLNAIYVLYNNHR